VGRKVWGVKYDGETNASVGADHFEEDVEDIEPLSRVSAIRHQNGENKKQGKGERRAR